MSYTTKVVVNVIRSNGSLDKVAFNFTNEKEAYTFYLKASGHENVESVDFPGDHFTTWNNADKAMTDLDFFAK